MSLTPQEEFWRSQFGDSYIERNRSEALLASNIAFFASALRHLRIESVLEVGANIGMNLKALAQLFPGQKQTAIEINPSACEILAKELPNVTIHEGSATSVEHSGSHELVISKTVLIHVNPDLLPDLYARMARWSSKYVLIAEYYNPKPVMVEYRGHSERLFKRDFAGEFLKSNEDFSLRDYGFLYSKDPQHPQDDITWFLLERK